MTLEQRDNGGLFAVHDGDLVTLTPVDDFPEAVAAVVDDHLDQIVGEPMVNVVGWSQEEAAERPAVLAFDGEGMLTAVVLAGANDSHVILERVQAILDWLTDLTLRDVLGMHESVDILVDRLLDLNPNEVHLSLDPGRRIIIVTLCDLGEVQSEVELIAPNLAIIDLEVFADPSGEDSLIRRIPSSESLPVVQPDELEGEAKPDDNDDEAATSPEPDSSAEAIGSDDDIDLDEIAQEDASEVGEDELIEPVAQGDDGLELADETGVESSLAPPPPVLPVPILAQASSTNTVIELPFVAGRSMVTAELLATLGQLGTLELFDDGTMALGEHVLLTQVLSQDVDIDSPTHFHRAVDEASIARFQGWYDGDLANVRFHLVVRNADTPAESTYLGELKPTAWEHLPDGQQLLFKIVPRIGAGLWQTMSNGDLPPIETVIDLTGPTADQALVDSEVDLRDGSLLEPDR